MRQGENMPSKTVFLNFPLDPELRKALKIAAAKRGAKMHVLITEILERFVKEDSKK
jgi:hypothetical protein